jgi:hypothetical protein
MTWIDWAVVAFVIGISIAAGMWVVRFSSRHGAWSCWPNVACGRSRRR